MAAIYRLVHNLSVACYMLYYSKIKCLILQPSRGTRIAVKNRDFEKLGVNGLQCRFRQGENKFEGNDF